MNKLNIIRFLQKLAPCHIKMLDIVYHKMTFNGYSYYRYQYSTTCPVECNTPLVEVLLSLYKLRGNIRALHLIYFDSQGQMQQLDCISEDFIDCNSLSDFINSK